MRPNKNVILSNVLCGIDEAGRGPLAGPVYVAAVVLGDEGLKISGINDSKKLSEKRRDALAIEIKQRARAWSIVAIDEATIDSINILQATLLGMQRAYESLHWQEGDRGDVHEIVIDGTQLPKALVQICHKTRVLLRAAPKADADVTEVGAASILAKTARDAYMIALDTTYPGYGFAKHKGYGTAEHIEAIHRLGPCAAHRKTFAPISQLTLL